MQYDLNIEGRKWTRFVSSSDDKGTEARIQGTEAGVRN